MMNNLIAYPKRRSSRHGISIIEVLTSMAVATIGVLGVMVMIPFAVKQSQTGLDYDLGNAVGRNAVDELEIHGFLRSDASSESVFLAQYDQALGTPIAATFDFNMPNAFHLDPMRLSEDPAVRGDIVSFPQLPTVTPLGDTIDFEATTLPIPSLSLVSPLSPGTAGIAPIPFSKAEAARIFRTYDDIIVGKTNYLGTETEDTDPPQQYYDLSPTGVPIRRQAESRISWSALMIPQTTDSYRAHVLVYSDRSVINNDEDAVSFVAEVTRNNAMGTATGKSGHESSVREIPLVRDYDIASVIFKDDWVMLINQMPAPDPAAPGPNRSAADLATTRHRAAAAGFDIQVAFCKVLRADNNSDTILVDGESFDFYNTDVAGAAFGTAAYDSVTYVVHLPNVVNVYERSISVER